MAKHKLIDRWIQAARPASAGRREIGDALCPGLYLRITVTGVKTWSVVIRVRDQVQRHTLGRYPVVTLASAREQALKLLRHASEGGDLPADAEAARAEAERAAEDTSASFGALVDAYETHIKANARSWQMIDNSLRRAEVMPLHAKRADEVTRRELMGVIDGIAAAGTCE
nr:Arm DNA-binding domain-containing protein [Sphingomonas jatrophae]